MNGTPRTGATYVDLVSDVAQQGEVFLGEVSEGAEAAPVAHSQHVQVLRLLRVPLHVGQQHKARLLVRVLVKDALCLLLVLQDVVHPLRPDARETLWTVLESRPMDKRYTLSPPTKNCGGCYE